MLVVGGGPNSAIGIPSGDGVPASALVFDPATSAVTPVGSMTDPRAGHLATLLADGRVLVAGGATDEVGTPCTQVPNCATGKALASAKVFDPATSAFTKVGDMTTRLAAVIRTLADGKPLIAGGADDTDSVTNVDLLDATTNTFAATAPLLHDCRPGSTTRPRRPGPPAPTSTGCAPRRPSSRSSVRHRRLGFLIALELRDQSTGARTWGQQTIDPRVSIRPAWRRLSSMTNPP